MPDLHIDLETRSATDLRKAGVHVYAECPSTDIWCMAYAFGAEEPALWQPGQALPQRVVEHVAAGGPLVAHNAAFETTLWQHVLASRYGFPAAPVEQWRCTMAQAYAMALPGALADAAGALGLQEAKDASGHRIMLSMAKPRKVIGNLADLKRLRYPTTVDAEGWQTFHCAPADVKIQWWVEPERKMRLFSYCKQDVRTERALDERLLRLTDSEQRLWVLDQKINARGVVVDDVACENAMEIVDEYRSRINKQIKQVSNYEVASTTAVAQIMAYLAARGIEAEGLASDRVTELLLRDDLTEDVRKVLELRQAGARMSVAKINALMQRKGADGRARGMLQFHAASTGRWGGRGFQPQNLKRPDIGQDEIERLVDILRNKALSKAQRFTLFQMFGGDPIEALGNCIRALLTSPHGRQMAAADFANIEGRGLAWLAGEHWKVKAFEAYDRGEGPDLYKLAFSRSFGKPIDEVTKDDRQVGKVQELACGYAGGPGAFQAMARGYGLDIGSRYDQLVAEAAPEIVDEAIDAWGSYGSKSRMAERDWTAAEIVKRAWRREHPATVALWQDMEDGAVRAVQSPGAVIRVGKVRFRVSGSFLFMQLPSQERCLCYPYPKVETKTTPWGAQKELVTFFGQDTYTRKWGRTSTYGGKLTENCLAADTLVVTSRGLRRIDCVGSRDLVWDGVEWVSHSGVVWNGVAPTVDFGGARLTPEHRVLVEGEWKEAVNADPEEAASSFGRHHRLPEWSPHRNSLPWIRRPKVDLAGRLRVRAGDSDGGLGVSEGEAEVVRVPEGRAHRGAYPHARQVEAPGVRGLEFDAGAVLKPEAPSVAQLRGPRDHGVRALAPVLRSILAGHGTDVSTGVGSRPEKQRARILGGELSLGDAAHELQQHPAERAAEHPVGRDYGGAGGSQKRHRGDDVALPAEPRVAGKRAVRSTGLHESVFDIVNAGPRRRFTILLPDGRPVIVHNCVQALARDLLKQALFSIEDAGVETVLHVHDEAVLYCDVGIEDCEEFCALMARKPAWAEGLPVVAEGWVGERYRK